ncbi:hypothetical protein OK351_04575 [Glutamicibacter sp. MNS18]|uniref:hypothetical protein n=1 Tax=Glutamicibacter sp. MNS18 TaxID=2989817 RepID=UPI0022362B1A|nr:hypothetical protein [Glutamicibacter sp. MNS18]MCW4464780.1 hypothetical protein [Glutamicibacter sp. MNS18]
MMHGRKQADPVEPVLERYTDADRAWAHAFHASLVWADLTPEQCAAELELQRRSIRDSGQNPEELLGEPWPFGTRRAQAIRSPEQRALRELPVDSSKALLLGAGIVIGLLLLGFGLWVAFRDGWLAHSWQVWQLASLIGGAGVALSGNLAWFLRRNGRLRAGWLTLALGVTVALGSCAVLAITQGDKTLASPNLVVPVLGVVLVVGAVLLPYPDAVAGRLYQATDHRIWFDQCAALLRGRYGFTRAEAARVLEPARQHWRETVAGQSATGPLEEFGTPTEYAMSVAASTERPLVRRWMLRQLCYLSLVTLWGVSGILALLNEGPSAGNITFVAAWGLFAACVLYGLRPADRRHYVTQRITARRKDAEAVLEARDD